MDDVSLSKKIETLCRFGGHTHGTIAEVCGCDQSTISRIKKESTDPRYSVGRKIDAMYARLPRAVKNQA